MYETITDHVRFPGGGGEQEAWITRPAAPGQFPAIVMCHGRNGVTDPYLDVAVRFAEEGIVGIALNYFTIETDPSDPDEIATMAGILNVAQGLEYVRTDQIVLSGYCRGGGMTYLGLGNIEGFAAGVVWHGGLGGGEITARHPEQQFDAALRIQVPIIILHGMSDPGVPIQRVFELAQRLNELGKQFELKAYWGTRHAFTLPGGGDYVPEHADDAFREAVLFIRRTFGLPVGTVNPLTRQPVGV
jgi:carboxymethylenebutenolidase